MAERCVRNAEVRGSTPLISTRSKALGNEGLFALVLFHLAWVYDPAHGVNADLLVQKVPRPFIKELQPCAGAFREGGICESSVKLGLE